jgi:uncharacterized RDD family membrane protein YckC
VLTYSGPYELIAEALTDGNETYPFVLAFLITFLIILIPTLILMLILRPFSKMPRVKEQLTDMSPFIPKFKTDADISRYGALPSVLSRIIAFVIDRGIVVLVIALAGGIFVAVSEQAGGRGVLYMIFLVLFVVFTLAAAVYSYSRDMFGGKSIARRLLKQKVVDITTGTPIGGWRSFKRELLIHFAPLILIELILISSNSARRRIGDNWAKTIVVKDTPLQS